MKPKSPKDSKRKPKEVSGKVKEYEYRGVDWFFMELDKMELVLLGYHNGLPMYEYRYKDID